MDEVLEQIKRLFDRVCDLPRTSSARACRAKASSRVDRRRLSLCEADTRSARFIRPVAEALESMNAELPAGTRLGAWQIVSTLAAGGMGRVYLAQRNDGQYQQRVAIKLLRNLAGSGDEHYLLRERQILAELQHPKSHGWLTAARSESGRPTWYGIHRGERIDRCANGVRSTCPSRCACSSSLPCCSCASASGAALRIKPSIFWYAATVARAARFGIARLIDPDEHASEPAKLPDAAYASPAQKAAARCRPRATSIVRRASVRTAGAAVESRRRQRRDTDASAERARAARRRALGPRAAW